MEEEIKVGSVVKFYTEDDKYKVYNGSIGVIREVFDDIYLTSIKGEVIEAFKEELTISSALKEGVWVRTSQGKCGYIVKGETYQLGVLEGSEFLVRTEFGTYEEAQFNKGRYETIKRSLPIVKLGSKEVEIERYNLFRANRLIIRVYPELKESEKTVFSLPTKDAIVVIDVLRKNKIRFHVL